MDASRGLLSGSPRRFRNGSWSEPSWVGFVQHQMSQRCTWNSEKMPNFPRSLENCWGSFNADSNQQDGRKNNVFIFEISAKLNPILNLVDFAEMSNLNRSSFFLDLQKQFNTINHGYFLYSIENHVVIGLHSKDWFRLNLNEKSICFN